MQMFNKPFNFISNQNFLKKSWKLVFKAFYSDHALWNFLDTCRTFSVVYKKKVCLQKFWVLRYRKGISQKILLLSVGCRLNHKLLFGPPCTYIYKVWIFFLPLFISLRLQKKENPVDHKYIIIKLKLLLIRLYVICK